MHHDADGKRDLSDESGYIWLDFSLLGDIGNVPYSDVLPTIEFPLSASPTPLVHIRHYIRLHYSTILCVHYSLSLVESWLFTTEQFYRLVLIPRLCKGAYINSLSPAYRCILAAPLSCVLVLQKRASQRLLKAALSLSGRI